jgi:hypothetical protein
MILAIITHEIISVIIKQSLYIIFRRNGVVTYCIYLICNVGGKLLKNCNKLIQSYD